MVGNLAVRKAALLIELAFGHIENLAVRKAALLIELAFDHIVESLVGHKIPALAA